MSAEALHRGLKEAGITLVSSLPDDWVAPVISAIDGDEEITHVPVAREVEAVGVCAGAWLGGIRSMAVMGMAGLLACAHEFTTLNTAHQMPLFILSSMRGTREDRRTYQVAQGMVGTDYLDAMRISHEVLDHVPDAKELREAYEYSLITKRPFVLLATKQILASEGRS